MVNTMEPRYVIQTRRYRTDVAVPRFYEEVKCKNIAYLTRECGPDMRCVDL